MECLGGRGDIVRMGHSYDLGRPVGGGLHGPLEHDSEPDNGKTAPDEQNCQAKHWLGLIYGLIGRQDMLINGIVTNPHGD